MSAKANHKELLGLSFNGRLKNYFNDDFEYHDYNVGDLIMVEDKRMSGDIYIAVGIIINKRYDKNYKTYQLNYVALSTGSCDYGNNWISGTLEEIDKKVIKHLPKYCIDEYLENKGGNNEK